MADEDIREELWGEDIDEDDFVDDQRALTLRRKLFYLFTFVRSRDLRDRVAGLSFGDMLQEAIEAIDSDQRTSGDVAAKTQRHPNAPEPEPRDQGLARGRLQELAELEKMAFGDKATGEKGVFDLMDELVEDEVLSTSRRQGDLLEEEP